MRNAAQGPNRNRLLVTGVCGDFGQGFVKALRLSPRPYEIHGCDKTADGIGATFVDVFHAVPPASEVDAYFEEIDRLCTRHGLDAVIPGSPVEIETLGRLGYPSRLPCGVPLICLPAPYRGVYNDKLRCYRALEGKVDLAPFADGADPEAVRAFVKEHGFPLVVKQRRGQGGVDFHVVHRPDQLEPALAATPDPVLQGFIDEAGGEYSIGVFATNGSKAAIVFRRRLGRTGSSWYAETVDDPAVLAYGLAVASASLLRGSANVQVRKSSQGIRLLEINARFSSLAPARAYAGFRDIEWSVDLALGRVPDLPKDGYRRFRFQRFVHEMVDEGTGYTVVPQWNQWSRPPEPKAAPKRRRLYAVVKRTMDVTLSLIALILLSPVLAIVALVVRIGLGSPVLYLRRRPGLGEKPFTVFKFRTMLAGDQPDEMRMTRLGRFLRASSLDELPQLWNVLLGDMSLVGPRPLMMQYIGRYSPEQARRHEVKPGITGWAQVNGRNNLNWEDRFRFDVWYVDHASPWLDLWILLLTVIGVFAGSGVAAPGTGVESEFMGSPKEARRHG